MWRGTLSVIHGGRGVKGIHFKKFPFTDTHVSTSTGVIHTPGFEYGPLGNEQPRLRGNWTDR